LIRVKLGVVGEIPLVNEYLPLWPAFFPFFVEYRAPIFDFSIVPGLQVTLELSFEISFMLGSADPPFSHNDKGKKRKECESKDDVR
jgi:hypothetical protein